MPRPTRGASSAPLAGPDNNASHPARALPTRAYLRLLPPAGRQASPLRSRQPPDSLMSRPAEKQEVVGNSASTGAFALAGRIPRKDSN